jgi:ABC-type multidrug transport system fused ATPase/permease subunit
LYNSADVFLLDDVFSSVDPQVADKVFEKGVLGLMNDKTRIVIVNNARYLEHADLIVLLKRGRVITESGEVD